ncbi:hypothetical protein [Paraburkholderia metrosideri]|uniref:hypothetical protein n=1 Tax=Paraburkholderia metrosideri TaxID=580937 RepID=UPI001917B856|nr:hypothetical protein [Paraburkholderia metrosideri]
MSLRRAVWQLSPSIFHSLPLRKTVCPARVLESQRNASALTLISSFVVTPHNYVFWSKA